MQCFKNLFYHCELNILFEVSFEDTIVEIVMGNDFLPTGQKQSCLNTQLSHTTFFYNSIILSFQMSWSAGQNVQEKQIIILQQPKAKVFHLWDQLSAFLFENWKWIRKYKMIIEICIMHDSYVMGLESIRMYVVIWNIYEHLQLINCIAFFFLTVKPITSIFHSIVWISFGDK